MLGNILYYTFFFAIPIILVIYWGLSIYRYVTAKKQNKVVPGTFSDAEIKKRKIRLIILSVISVVFLAIVIGFIALIYMAVAYM